MNALKINNLEKYYWNKKVLDNINLEINEWDFLALLWYNGAWKTTMISILTNLLTKDSWKIKVFDFNMDKDLNKAKKLIWVVPQEYNFDMFAKVIDIPVLQGWYYGVPLKIAIERTEYYLKKLNLWEHKDKKVRELSWWMKRRLMIVRALIHNPKLLILDEPTAWVDVQLRQSMRDFIGELNKKWTTILLTTHYLEEAESLCDKIAILQDWKIIKQSTTKDLLSSMEEESFVFDLKNPLESLPKTFDWYKPILKNNYEIELTLKAWDTINWIFSLFEQYNIKVSSMKNKSNRLEQLFLKLTK